MTEKRFTIDPKLPRDRDGYLTVESTRNLLNELVRNGYGDYELLIGYDSNYGYTAFADEIVIDEQHKQILVQEYD